MKWNEMVKVFCPVVGAWAWANGTKDDKFRCTHCGDKGHQRV